MNSLRLLIPVSLLSIVALATAAVRIDATRAPEEEPAHEGRRAVQWVFTARDLISCKTVAYTLRHLRAESDPNLAVVAYGIDVNEADVRSFLRAERLNVELVTGSARRYEKQFNRRPASGIYVLRGDSVVRSFPSAPGRAYRAPPTVQQLLQSIPPSVETHDRTITPSRSLRRNL